MTHPSLSAEQTPSGHPSRFVLFALGFRPFFLGAGLAACALIALWILDYIGALSLTNYYGEPGWHAHEMLFGYTMAVVAGFLLTAVRNWTGIQTLHGLPLAGLFVVWIAGRIAPLVPVIPPWSVAIVDLLFLPLLAIAIAIPLIKAKQHANMIFVLLLVGLLLSNTMVHMDILGLSEGMAPLGITLALYIFILMITIMGGRVIPFFIERGTGSCVRSWRFVELMSPLSVIVLALIDIFKMNSQLLGLAAVITAIIHGIRLGGWFRVRVFTVPLLWVLLSGYTWLVLGFALMASSNAGLHSPLLATHAITVGGIGVITLGMMARVALGHSGRPMQVAKLMTIAFSLINLAALVRVLLPSLMPQAYTSLIVISGSIWSLGFLIFLYIYTPILLNPRVDGKPG